MVNLMAMAADQLLAAKPAMVFILASEYMAGGTSNGEAYTIVGVYATREGARAGLTDWKADHGVDETGRTANGHCYVPDDEDEEPDSEDATGICRCGWDASITEHQVQA
jgi:hypothetical protein